MARETDGHDLTVQLGGDASDQLKILLDDGVGISLGMTVLVDGQGDLDALFQDLTAFGVEDGGLTDGTAVVEAQKIGFGFHHTVSFSIALAKHCSI